MSAVAHAHPNIALIKYWGKAPGAGNVPAAPSISITLDTLTTTTEVREADADRFVLNGRETTDAKVAECVHRLRQRYRIPPVAVQSDNNFPTAAGLASSASGFAALVTAVDAAFDLGMSAEERAVQARQASASAARSMFGGFVALEGPDWWGEPLLTAEDWPLSVVIAVTDASSKAIPSSDGMRLSAATSPYYPIWVESTHLDYRSAAAAVQAKDFAVLAALAEHSCLKMHAVMLSTRPGLIYWNATTVACLHRVRELREAGESVFFTVDAGPQVKAVCLPENARTVQNALASVPGVLEVLTTGLGRGAWTDSP